MKHYNQETDFMHGNNALPVDQRRFRTTDLRYCGTIRSRLLVTNHHYMVVVDIEQKKANN